MTAEINLSFGQGETCKTIIAWEAAEEPLGLPADIDLTGCTVRLQARTAATAADVVLDLSLENGGITLPAPTDGLIGLFIPADLTAQIPAGVYFYDLKITFAEGTVTRLMAGTLTVTAQITQ